MRNRHNPYPREYRDQIIVLIVALMSVRLNLNRIVIRSKAGIRAARRFDAPPPCPDEREELLRLRKENRILRQERDILSKNVLVCRGRTALGA